MKVFLNDKYYDKLVILGEISGIKKSDGSTKESTIIRLLLFEQINLYKTDKPKFFYNWGNRGDCNKNLMQADSINCSLSDINKEIDEIKERVEYQGAKDKFVSILVMMGLKEVYHNRYFGEKDKKEILEEIQTLHEGLYDHFDNCVETKKAELNISKGDILKWELMKEALDIRCMLN